MAKVEFTRVETDAEVEDIDIKDGQLIYTGTGKTYMDYGNERIPTGSGGGSEVVIDDEEPTSDDWKLWIDTGEIGSAASEITNEYSESTGLGYSADYINKQNEVTTLSVSDIFEFNTGYGADNFYAYKKGNIVNIQRCRFTGGVTTSEVVIGRVKSGFLPKAQASIRIVGSTGSSSLNIVVYINGATGELSYHGNTTGNACYLFNVSYIVD